MAATFWSHWNISEKNFAVTLIFLDNINPLSSIFHRWIDSKFAFFWQNPFCSSFLLFHFHAVKLLQRIFLQSRLSPFFIGSVLSQYIVFRPRLAQAHVHHHRRRLHTFHKVRMNQGKHGPRGQDHHPRGQRTHFYSSSTLPHSRESIRSSWVSDWITRWRSCSSWSSSQGWRRARRRTFSTSRWRFARPEK